MCSYVYFRGERNNRSNEEAWVSSLLASQNRFLEERFSLPLCVLLARWLGRVYSTCNVTLLSRSLILVLYLSLFDYTRLRINIEITLARDNQLELFISTSFYSYYHFPTTRSLTEYAGLLLRNKFNIFSITSSILRLNLPPGILFRLFSFFFFNVRKIHRPEFIYTVKRFIRKLLVKFEKYYKLCL